MGASGEVLGKLYQDPAYKGVCRCIEIYAFVLTRCACCAENLEAIAKLLSQITDENKL